MKGKKEDLTRCTLNNKELAIKVDDLVDGMYRTMQVPPRRIPAQVNNDFDLLVVELCRRTIKKFDEESEPEFLKEHTHRIVRNFINLLREDTELKQVYHDNIAMAFTDAMYNEMSKQPNKAILTDISYIGNKAAEEFLYSLLYVVEEPEPNKAYITTGRANQFITT